MRRICAMLLVAVFSFTLIDPGVFAALGERKLAACCRRDGKHHCVTTGPGTSSTPAFRAGWCAWFSVQQTMPPVPAAGTVKPFQAIFAAIVSHPTARPQIRALGRVSFDRSSQKRGPPIVS